MMLSRDIGDADLLQAAEPYEPLMVDVEPVLALGPFIALARPTAGSEEVAFAIEAQYLRRGQMCLVGGKRPRSVKQPRVIPRVDSNA